MIKKINLKPRLWCLIAGGSCFAMLGVGAFFQFVMDLAPCPLCISQRIAILLLGIVFLSAAAHNPERKGITVYAILGALVAVAGGSISARHVWIQHLPPNEVPECGPGLSYVFENFPLTETLKLMLSGTGECAKVDWSLFGISIPGWTLLAFIGLAIVSVLQIWNKPAAF
jgi:disulfide bond formation protein DsbB